MSNVVGWNLFHEISKAVHSVASAADHVVKGFSHIMHDLGPIGVAAAAALGLPEIAGAGMIDLLMKDHAGSKPAAAKLREVSARGGNWPALIHNVAQAIKAHPDFAEFHAHATAAKVHGVARPAPPTAYSNRPGARQGPAPGPSLPPQRQYPDDSLSPQDGDDGSYMDPGY